MVSSPVVEVENSATQTMKKYNAQRSTKKPLREPAGFPINQNFSQRIISEYDDDEYDDGMILVPYPSPPRLISVLPAIQDEVRHALVHSSSQPGTSKQPVRENSTLRKTIKRLASWNKKSSVVNQRVELQVVDASGGTVAKVDSPGTSLSTSDVDVAVKESNNPPKNLSPSRMQKLRLSWRMTPKLTSSLRTPSTIDALRTPGHCVEISTEDESYFTRPMVGQFTEFRNPPSPQPPFSMPMDSFLVFPTTSSAALQSPAHAFSGVAKICPP